MKVKNPVSQNIYIWVSLNVHPYSIHCGCLLFFETTIMGNTADLAMVQKKIIDTLHKEGKSQKVITERVAVCSQSAVSKHIKYKVDWKEEIGLENMHKQQGWPQTGDYCQAKPVQTLGRASQGVNWSWSQCIKSHHAQTSSGKELPSHFWNRNNPRSFLPGLRRKINGLLLSGPKSSFQMKVNLAFNLEIIYAFKVWILEEDTKAQNPSCLKSSVKFPKSAIIWGAVMSSGVGPLWSIGPLCFDLLTLAPAHSAKSTSKWFVDHDITVLDWPANVPDLNPLWNLWDIFKRKMRNSRSNNTDELKSQ